MFAANVFTIIDSQDMQERNRLGPVAVTPGGAQCKRTGPEDRSSVSCLPSVHLCQASNSTAQPQASAAPTTSRPPAAWNGTLLRVSRSETRSVTRVAHRFGPIDGVQAVPTAPVIRTVKRAGSARDRQ